MKTQAIRNLFIIVSATLFFVSCGNNKQSKEEGKGIAQGEIRLDGSSTIYPLAEAVAEDFGRANKGVRVTVGESGTGGGFKKFGRGEVDVANASRPIKSSEEEMCKASGIEFIELPVAYDGLAVVVNPGNTWLSKITVAELKKIWEPAAQGKILRWNQVNPNWPDSEIHLFGAGTQSGTFDYFTEAIVGKSKECRGDYTASEDDNVLVQGVAGDNLALGFFGLAYYENNKDKLKLVPVDDEIKENGEGAVAPSAETVQNGTYQPLSRPLFIYVNKKATEREEVKAFVDYFIENTGKLSDEVGYVALPDAVHQLVKQRWAAGTTGSVFAGISDVGVKLEEVLGNGTGSAE